MDYCASFLLTLIFIFVLFKKISRRFDYYFKFTLYCITTIFTGGFCFILFLFRPKNNANFKIPVRFAKVYAKLMGWKYEIINKPKYEYNDAAVVILNHQSCLDVLSLSQVWPNNSTILAKKQVLYYTGPFGWALWLCNGIFIDRDNRNAASLQMKYIIENIKTERYKIIIFPEGTRSQDKDLKTFKVGAFKLAIEAQIPIIPMVISSYKPFLDDSKKTFEPGNIRITYLPIVQTQGLKLTDVQPLSIQLHNDMNAVFKNS